MKQTAVEWLEEYIRCSIQLTDSEKKWFEQAKEMEKDQIIEAVDVCLGTVELSEDKSGFTALSGEGYYKERYILKTI
jgi:hypothetical protein